MVQPKKKKNVGILHFSFFPLFLIYIFWFECFGFEKLSGRVKRLGIVEINLLPSFFHILELVSQF